MFQEGAALSNIESFKMYNYELIVGISCGPSDIRPKEAAFEDSIETNDIDENNCTASGFMIEPAELRPTDEQDMSSAIRFNLHMEKNVNGTLRITTTSTIDGHDECNEGEVTLRIYQDIRK